MKKRTVDDVIVVGADRISGYDPDRVIEVETLGGVPVARIYNGPLDDIQDYLDTFYAPQKGATPAQGSAQENMPPFMDDALLDALNTVIKIDPFGGKYTGKPVREACKSPEWLARALRDLKNDFLKDRLRIVDDYLKEGGKI